MSRWAVGAQCHKLAQLRLGVKVQGRAALRAAHRRMCHPPGLATRWAAGRAVRRTNLTCCATR